jgi:hypothetical protein
MASLARLMILVACAWTAQIWLVAAATKGEIATEVGATVERMYTQVVASKQLAGKAACSSSRA